MELLKTLNCWYLMQSPPARPSGLTDCDLWRHNFTPGKRGKKQSLIYWPNLAGMQRRMSRTVSQPRSHKLKVKLPASASPCWENVSFSWVYQQKGVPPWVCRLFLTVGGPLSLTDSVRWEGVTDSHTGNSVLVGCTRYPSLRLRFPISFLSLRQPVKSLLN